MKVLFVVTSNFVSRGRRFYGVLSENGRSFLCDNGQMHQSHVWSETEVLQLLTILLNLLY